MSEQTTPNSPVILVIEMHKTISDGNYGNSRYRVPVPIEWTPGEPLEPLYAKAFETARAQIEVQAVYDKLVRGLMNQYEYGGGETVEQWNALIAFHANNIALQPHDRQNLIALLTRHRDTQLERDERENLRKEHIRKVVGQVVAATFRYVVENPIPPLAVLWATTWRNDNTPEYYHGLWQFWKQTIKDFDDLPHHVRNNLANTTVEAIANAGADRILDYPLTPRQRPSDAELDAVAPDDEQEVEAEIKTDVAEEWEIDDRNEDFTEMSE